MITAQTPDIPPAPAASETASSPRPVYHLDVSVHETILQTQDTMRYFFSDKNSATRSFPATGKALALETPLSDRVHLNASFSFPLNQQMTYVGASTQPRTFNFSKSLLVGVDLLATTIDMSAKSWLEVRPELALLTPASERFLDYVIPTLALRARLSFDNNTGFYFGGGYSGIVTDGSFFLDYGVSYRL